MLQYMAFCVWLLSENIMIWGFTQVVTGVIIPFLCIAE